jgi:hypothetical protein
MTTAFVNIEDRLALRSRFGGFGSTNSPFWGSFPSSLAWNFNVLADSSFSAAVCIVPYALKLLHCESISWNSCKLARQWAAFPEKLANGMRYLYKVIVLRRC